MSKILQNSAKQYIKATISGLIFDSPKLEKILLIKRENEPYKGVWSYPGGHLEYGETIEYGIKREIMEETGYTVKFFKNPFYSVNQIIRTDMHYIVLSKCCYINTSIPQNVQSKEDIYQEFFYLDRYFPHLKNPALKDYRKISELASQPKIINFFPILDIHFEYLKQHSFQ